MRLDLSEPKRVFRRVPRGLGKPCVQTVGVCVGGFRICRRVRPVGSPCRKRRGSSRRPLGPSAAPSLHDRRIGAWRCRDQGSGRPGVRLHGCRYRLGGRERWRGPRPLVANQAAADEGHPDLHDPVPFVPRWQHDGRLVAHPEAVPAGRPRSASLASGGCGDRGGVTSICGSTGLQAPLATDE